MIINLYFQVYVYENNIFYVPNVNDTHYQVTTTGVDGVIFNGVTDWLYGGKK